MGGGPGKYTREECIIAVFNYDGDKKCDIANVDEGTCWCQFGDDTSTDQSNVFTCFLEEYCTDHPSKCKEDPNAKKGKDCQAFDIDSYLLQCSDEFSSSSEDLEEISKKVGGLKGKLDDVNDKIGNLETEDGRLDREIKAVDAKLGKVDNALNKKLDDALVTINALEDTLKGFQKKSSAQAALGSVDLLDTNQPSAMSTASQDTLIICLVVFNIGTILGCISCLFWSKRGGAKGYVSKVVYDGVSNFDEEELKN